MNPSNEVLHKGVIHFSREAVGEAGEEVYAKNLRQLAWDTAKAYGKPIDLDNVSVVIKLLGSAGPGWADEEHASVCVKLIRGERHSPPTEWDTLFYETYSKALGA